MVASECRFHPSADESGDSAKGRPGILVVDDDSSVRSILNLLLQHEGFRVCLASTGKEAVECYRREKGSIRLVLVDQCLPDMSGSHVFQKLRRVEPQVHCCFMTGQWDAEMEQALLEQGVTKVFKKPFMLVDVIRHLRALVAADVSRQ